MVTRKLFKMEIRLGDYNRAAMIVNNVTAQGFRCVLSHYANDDCTVYLESDNFADIGRFVTAVAIQQVQK